MAYAAFNFKTKKSLKDEVKRISDSGGVFVWFQPGPFGSGAHDLEPGETVTLEGPHSPAPHSWYATVTNKNGKLIVK